MIICFADIVEKVKSGVVRIIHKVNGERVSSRTGFMIEGLLVTNYHVAYTPPTNTIYQKLFYTFALQGSSCMQRPYREVKT